MLIRQMCVGSRFEEFFAQAKTVARPVQLVGTKGDTTMAPASTSSLIRAAVSIISTCNSGLAPAVKLTRFQGFDRNYLTTSR
jgi:hypothetical protein